MKIQTYFLLLLGSSGPSTISSFSQCGLCAKAVNNWKGTALTMNQDASETQLYPRAVVDRRSWLTKIATTAAATASILTVIPNAVLAAEGEGTATIAAPGVVMKDFVDPVGYFSISVPKTFFTLRRSAKGDLPDAKTGKGRRGSSIFTAGDMAKAEVVAVERFPTRLLLEENGIEANGELATFPSLGNARAVAELIKLRRERDKPTQKTFITPESVKVSEDGKTLYFEMKTEIDVQKPELLLEQMGVSELFRITLAKASLESNDGNLMAVFASALQQDFDGVDGAGLRTTIDSFTVMDTSGSS